MADITLTTTATILSIDQSISITIYEDTNQDGTAEAQATQSVDTGTNSYTLSGFAGGSGNNYWADISISTTDDEVTASVDSLAVDPGGVGAAVTISVPTATASTSAPLPTVGTTRTVSVSAPTTTATASASVPSISSTDSELIGVPTTTATASASAPTIGTTRFTSVAPATASTTASALTPTLTVTRPNSVSLGVPTTTATTTAQIPHVNPVPTVAQWADPIEATVAWNADPIEVVLRNRYESGE